MNKMLCKTSYLIFLSFVWFTCAEETVVEQAFEDAQIVPDVVSTAPKDLLIVSFDTKTVNLGNELSPVEATAPPQIQFNGTKGALYTLLEVDPDAPGLPEYTNIRHWVVTNIPGDSSNIEDGDLITEYAYPRPPVGDGFHRYTFLIYKQAARINVEFGESRIGFNVKEFASNYTLEGPLFGNYFRAQNAE